MIITEKQHNVKTAFTNKSSVLQIMPCISAIPRITNCTERNADTYLPTIPTKKDSRHWRKLSQLDIPKRNNVRDADPLIEE